MKHCHNDLSLSFQFSLIPFTSSTNPLSAVSKCPFLSFAFDPCLAQVFFFKKLYSLSFQQAKLSVFERSVVLGRIGQEAPSILDVVEIVLRK